MSKKILQGEWLTLGFSGKEVTPWGGFALLKQMLDQSGFYQSANSWGLPLPGSNRGYNPVQLLEQFIVSVWSGACRFAHIDFLRFDETLKKLFRWKEVAGRMTFSRFFGRFTRRAAEDVQSNMFQWINSKAFGHKNVTLDIDTTVITRYGDQDGATVGYNPKKKGRPSHHPLLAFVAETKLVANFWLRPGNAHSTNNIIPFLQSTLDNLRGIAVSLLRADSGFYDHKIMSFLEDESIDYIIAVKLYQSLQRKLYHLDSWWTVAPGIQISEFLYRGDGWSKDRRFIAVRQSVKTRPDAPGKNLKLFEDDDEISGWRYGLLVTSMYFSPEIVWRTYRLRSDSENRIKELKADFGLDSFNLKDFWATEAALAATMLAYNLMSLFRQAVLRTKSQHTLATMHGKVFAIGAYWDRKSGPQNHLLLCVPRKKRAWFSGLWTNASQPPEITRIL
jgi:hypothetical protein